MTTRTTLETMRTPLRYASEAADQLLDTVAVPVAVPVVESPSVESVGTAERWRRSVRLLVGLVRVRPGLFAVAVTGAAVYAVATVAASAVLRTVTDEVILPRFEGPGVSRETAMFWLLAIIVVGLVRSSAVVVRRTFAAAASFRTAQHLSSSVVDRIVAQPVTWHRRRTTGELIARAGVDVDASISVMHPLPFATSVVVMVFVAGSWLIAIDSVLGVAAVCIFPLMTALNIWYERRVGTHYDEAQRHLGELSSAVHESFEAVAVVKAFGAERRERDRLAVLAGRLRHSLVRVVRVRSAFESFLDAVPTVVNVGLVVLGAVRISSGDATVGDVTSVVYLFTLLAFPLRMIGYALSELPHSRAGWERVRAITDEALERDPVLDRTVADPGTALCVRDLSFDHPDGTPALRHVDLHLVPGSVTAIVGPTGAGKSTLVQALAGLVPVDGSVAVGSRGTALVFQEAFLFSGTVRDNLVLGLEPVPSEGDLREVLGAAEALEFVESLPDGLDTEVGERGIGLSGGQRQRIALARAVLRRPSVLILDDTTAALDPLTEARVLANLRSVLGEAAVLAIASRPSTISIADRVVFLESGTVSALGTHEELLGNVSAYRTLVESFDVDRAGRGPEEIA
jgi:ATP-binding cassette, subfamily B, bacterial